MSKRKKIWIAIVAVIVLAAAIIASIPAGRNMFAAVIAVRPVPVAITSCFYKDNLFACAHCATVPEVVLACSLWSNLCPVACQTPTATGTICPTRCETNICNDPGVVFACQQNPNAPTCPAACAKLLPGYGYGYGYNSGGTYGYGYGYKKVDKSGKPWMYLLVPFKTYSKAVYQAAIDKYGSIVSKYYDKKTFTSPVK